MSDNERDMIQVRDMASNLREGDVVLDSGTWYPVLRVSRTSEGVRVVYDANGWYFLIEPHKMVSVRKVVAEYA